LNQRTERKGKTTGGSIMCQDMQATDFNSLFADNPRLAINEQRLVGLFCDLVQIDSPSRQERNMADHLQALLEALGGTVEEDDAAAALGGNCGNLYARLPGKLPGPPLLLSVHMDTVEPCHGKRAIVGADGIIRSGGDTILGADDLAGIAAILEAVRTADELGLPRRSLEVMLSVAEELHLTGSHHMQVERLRAKEAYVLDTSGAPGKAVLAAPGHIWLEFLLKGKAAHAGIIPEAGISAIQAAALGIAAMPLGRIDPQTTANIGRVEGGGETNIVADTCRVTAECRSLDLGRLRAQAEAMKQAMQSGARQVGAQLTVTEKISYLPYQIGEDSPVVRRFREACRLVGLDAKLGPTGGGSDNNVLALQGIEGIVMACGMDQVHSCQEQIRVRDLVDTARLVCALICLAT
jgi:tripeptide aminopeptidase